MPSKQQKPCLHFNLLCRCGPAARPRPHLAHDWWNPGLLHVPGPRSELCDWSIPGCCRSAYTFVNFTVLIILLKAKQNLSQFNLTLGKPAMPIYWALGYHLCRWGYKSSNKTWDVVKEMRNYGIPQVL